MAVQNSGHLSLDLGCWGQRVRVLRKRKGWTVRQLSDRSGVGRTTISNIETGQHPNPGLDVLVRLQHALGLDSIEALLGDLPSVQLVVSDPDTERTA